MAYSTEIKKKAQDLYVIEGSSLRKTAKILNFKRWQTLQRWANKDKWRQKRARFAEDQALKYLAKQKSEYILENLKATELNKTIGINFLLEIYKELKIELSKINPDPERILELASQYKIVSSALNQSIRIQQKILAGNYDFYYQEQLNLDKQKMLAMIVSRASDMQK